MDAVHVEDAARRRRWIAAASGTLVLATLLAGFVWWRPWEPRFPIGSSRAVVLQVDECGAMEVEVEGQRWSSGGTAGPELANAFALGPEPGTIRRESVDEAPFTSDLTGHTVVLRRPEFVNLGCTGTPLEPGGIPVVSGS